MNTAAIYVRISDDAEGEALGVARQEQDCRALAARLGLTIIEPPYRDNDTGASTRTKKKRKTYPRMLADAEARKFSHILAYSNSRITRRPMELEELIQLHERSGVQVQTVVSGKSDLSTADGRQYARILAAIDAGEAERTGERLTRRQQDDRAQGRYGASKRAWGWGTLVPHPQRAGRTMVIDADKLNDTEGPALRWGIGRVLEGASLRSLAVEWNRQGLLTASNNTWTATRVRDVLVRWRNAGIMQHNGEPMEGSPGSWDPVCTPEDLRLLRGLLLAPERRTTPGRTPTDLLSALACCTACGRVMYSGKQRSVRKDGALWFDVYRCSGAQSTTGDKCWTSIKRETLDEIVIKSLRRRLTFGPSTGLAPSSEERAQLMALRSERAEIAEEQVEVGRMIGDRVMSPSTAEPALRGLSERLEAIDTQIRAIESRYAFGALFGAPERSKWKWKRSDALSENFRSLDLAEQREVIRLLLRVEVNKGRDPRERVAVGYVGWAGPVPPHSLEHPDDES